MVGGDRRGTARSAARFRSQCSLTRTRLILKNELLDRPNESALSLQQSVLASVVTDQTLRASTRVATTEGENNHGDAITDSDRICTGPGRGTEDPPAA